MLAVIMLAKKDTNYPNVAPLSQSGFWKGAQEFWFPILSTILDLPLEFFLK
jgi:hypothetical protein